MNLQRTTIAILATLLATSFALADEFKTVDGKEYKDATVTHVEPDGIVVKTKSGISKVYFVELPKEVQQRFNYDPQQATAYSAAQSAAMQRNAQQLAKEQASNQSVKQQQQDAGSLQARLQTLQPEKYNIMEHIRAVQSPGSPKSAQADLPILKDHLHDVNREINSIKNQLRQVQRTQQQQQDAASLQARLPVLQQQKYNTMEHIREVSAAPDYVRGIPNSVKADLPVLQDYLDDVNWEIKSIKDQLEGTRH